MSPGNEERRPAADGTPFETTAAHLAADDRSEATALEAPADQLRRRRALARRLAPLEDGRADPLDARARPSTCSPRELASWRAAWSHLRDHGFPVEVPDVVVAAGERERFRAGAR